MSTTEETIKSALSALVPPGKTDFGEWLKTEFRTHDGQSARAFSEYEVPWVTAPNGPSDAVDNPRFRFIWLQWAARCFKTTFGQAVMTYHMDIDPCSMMFATADEKLCETVLSRFWKIVESTPRVMEEVPPHPRDRSNTHMRLLRSEVFGAWSRGVSTLADKAIKIGHANEVPKWAHASTSKEGDPLQRFFKRGNQFADAKFIAEGTPTKRGSCPIEAGYLRSTACRFWVPCPHCGKFQPLIFGNGREPPGVFFAKAPDGSLDADIARKTGHYLCGHCHGRIEDLHRPQMMNLGVHVPDGCHVDHDLAMQAREERDAKKSERLPEDRFSYDWLLGEPRHDGPEYGSQVSVLYALFHGWGDIAADYCNRKRRVADHRQWINEDMAETWTERTEETEWEQLGQQIIISTPRRVIPEEFVLLTAGVDRQADGTMPYTVTAWDPLRRCCTIDYGYATDTDQLYGLLTREYEHEDGGKSLKIRQALIDSGFRPKDIAQFVTDARRQKVPILMCKGSSRELSTMFSTTRLPRTSATPGMILVNVDTATTQDWIDTALHDLRMDEEESVLLYSDTIESHRLFLQQLLNDEAVEQIKPDGNTRYRWERRDKHLGNDYRDCMRYSRVAMEIYTRGGPILQRGIKPPRRAMRPAVTMPDGRPFFLGDR